MLNAVKTLEDAMAFAKQIHDMTRGDKSLMENTDRALMIMYEELLKIQSKPKRGRPPKKQTA